MGMNLRLSSSPNGTRNLTFNPQVVASELHVFGMDPSDPTQYLVPGNGAPAVSTSAFYNSAGLYRFRCYDLDQMGATGASIKSAQGGRRYVWVCSADHPIFSYDWRGGSSQLAGFSFQPWDFPRQMNEIIPIFNNQQTTNHTVSGGFQTYQSPFIFYNPDDADGLPIYLMAETGPDHYTLLWRTSDFVTFTPKEISHWHTPTGTFTSFVRYAKRNGPNDYTTICLSGTTPTSGLCNALWSSTDGIEYTSSYTPIVGWDSGHPEPVSGSSYAVGGVFDFGSQKFGIGKEEATGGGLNQYACIFPLDPTTFDVQSGTKYRLASGWGNSSFPGPAYLQECSSYVEDGIAYLLPTYGFPNDVNTTAGGNGRGGAPYSLGGGLDHQFIDKLVVRYDDVAARQSAPVGVAVSCVSGVVTISWKDALPQNTYRVYRGTSAATQATLIGDVAGTSTTDSPSAGRYWYKVVTLDSGTERKSRVIPVYASSSSAFVNSHIDRILDDGADITTINQGFLDRADAMLDSVGIRSVLELFTHPAAGVKTSTSPIKIYDIGTTRLPRSEDFKPTTSATTYSATATNGGPGWINANDNSYGYWGNSKRGNTIQQKRQLTIIAAYERTQTTEDFTFVGTGPIFGTSLTGNAILTLQHTAGTPGNIQFSLSDETSTKTASVTASGSGMQIAIGTYDGTNMLAYTGSTAGSAVSTLDPNPDFGKSTPALTPGFVLGSLAGGRNSQSNGSSGDAINVAGFGFKNVYPFLGSGSVHCYNLRGNGVADDMKYNETNAKGKIQCVMVLEGALTPTQIVSVISFLQSTTNW